MALSDILQVIASKKDEQILHMREEFVAVEKNLLEEADKKGVEYSAQRFRDFENAKSTKEKKHDADTTRSRRVALSDFQNSVMSEVFAGVEKEVLSFSGDTLESLCTSLISSISEKSGVIRSAGTDISVLEAAVKKSGKDFTVESGDGTGGFVFVGDGYTGDFTFSSLVHRELREKCEADLFQKLFS